MPENGNAEAPDEGSLGNDRNLRNNETRRKIVALLTRVPGMNKHQIAQVLGVRLNSVVFHVKRLEDAGLLESRAGWNGRQTHFFTPENAHLWEEESTRLLYGRAPTRQVALYLAEHPGAQTEEVAGALDMSLRTAREHIRILNECGLVKRVQVKQRFEYFADRRLVTWAQDVAGDCTREWRTTTVGSE